MKVIDFHSHFLPKIDDGSRNLETTLEILKVSAQHGVDVMVATPHFYADTDRVEDFLNKRNRAYEVVKSEYHETVPEIILGAEVAYFEGMGRAEKIDALTIGSTENILLEMPFRTWRQEDLEQIEYMTYKRGFHVIIAHLERYLSIPGNRTFVSRLMDLPVTIQVNAECLLDKKSKKHIIKYLKKGKVHLLGSDCHGMHRRPPNLWEGRAVIEDELGIEILNRIDEEGCRLLNTMIK
jgi:protein-tyrosine phosphatase